MSRQDYLIENHILQKYTGTDGRAEIPEDVQIIGEEAFSGCALLVSVSLPEGLQKIEGYAFAGCTGLTGITLPDSLLEIGREAFHNCTGLQRILLPDRISCLESGVFSGCSGLTEIILPNNLQIIGQRAFQDCTSLTAISLPDSLQQLKEQAFWGCSGLRSVLLPPGLQSLSDNLFMYCSSLISIPLPPKLQNIGNRTFYGCSSLHHLILPREVSSVGTEAFWECRSLTGLILPEGLQEIGRGALEYCSSLSDIRLPKGIHEIRAWTFNGCTALTHISLPGRLDNVGEGAFGGCEGCLENRNGIFYAAGCVIGADRAIETLIPENKTAGIAAAAFQSCSGLKTVILPEGIGRIGENAFAECTDLETLVLPKGLKSIGRRAFYRCRKLRKVILPEGLLRLEDQAFAECSSLEELLLPESLTAWEEAVFADCSRLQKTEIRSKIRLTVPMLESIPPESLFPIEKLLPQMADGLLKEVLLHSDIWDSLGPEEQTNLFLNRQKKTLEPLWLQLTDEPEALGRQILLRFQGFAGQNRKPSAKICRALGSFLLLFGSQLTGELLLSLLDQLTALPAGADSVQKIRENPLLTAKIYNHPELLLPAEQYVLNRMQEENLSESLLAVRFQKLYGAAVLPPVSDREGHRVHDFVLHWLFTLHEQTVRSEGQSHTEAGFLQPGIQPRAAELLRLLDPESLQLGLENLAAENLCFSGPEGYTGHSRRMFLAYPFCRYADEKRMAALISRSAAWRTRTSGKNAPPLRTLRRAALYSCTEAAESFAELYGDLAARKKLHEAE